MTVKYSPETPTTSLRSLAAWTIDSSLSIASTVWLPAGTLVNCPVNVEGGTKTADWETVPSRTSSTSASGGMLDAIAVISSVLPVVTE